MAACTFFGHRDASYKIEDKLKSVIIDLIENKNVNLFYVGTHGNFDKLVKNLESLKKKYLNITYTIVLSHIPTRSQEICKNNYYNYIYPEGLENTPPKYAIINRNKWMIDHSDYVITHVLHNTSDVSKFKDIAEKKGKLVINLI